MSLSLLIKDEFTGFVKSKVMLAIWIGMPLIAAIIFGITPKVEHFPTSLFFASLVSSLGGTLASIMISVNLIHEINKKVYDIFLIRPITRQDILLSKYIAVFLCVAISIILSLILGFAIDYIKNGTITSYIFNNTLESLGYSLATMLVSCAIGLFIGIISPTVVMGIVLIIFVAGNVSSLIMFLPTMLELPNSFYLTLGLNIVVALALVLLSISIFKNKQF